METAPSSALDEPSYGGSDSQATTPTSKQERDYITQKHDVGFVSATFERQQSQSANSAQITNSDGSTWKTTFFRIAPLAGVTCMIAAVASILAAFGILVGSRGVAVASWNVPPSTYLAICTAIVNQALRFAAFQGLAIAWWYRATRGDTLAQLHHSWHSGITISGAIISGRNMGLIGLACLCSTLVAVDGPLLQKATTIELAALDSTPIPLSVRMGQEIPTGYTGGWFPTDFNERHSSNFNKTIPTVHGNATNLMYILPVLDGTVQRRWYDNDTIPGVISGCPKDKICKATIRAPALAVSKCILKKQPVDYYVPLTTLDKQLRGTGFAAPFATLAFLSTISLLLGEKESINLISGYGDYDNCTGTFYYRICHLESAIGEYDVTVSDGDRVQVDNKDPRIIALANNTQVSHQWSKEYQFYPSTLAGMVAFAFLKYNSAVNYFPKGDVVYSDGYYPAVYAKYITLHGGPPSFCWSFDDPTQDTIRDLNKFMFLIGVQVASGRDQPDVIGKMDPGLPVNTTTFGYLEGSHEVFTTDLYWFAGALVVELVCIALILPTYFGWWKLGRSVSFSPLELAKAFEAPLLSDCNSNSTGREIAKAVGGTRIKYGQVGRGAIDTDMTANQHKLAFGDPAVVSKPQNDEKYGP